MFHTQTQEHRTGSRLLSVVPSGEGCLIVKERGRECDEGHLCPSELPINLHSDYSFGYQYFSLSLEVSVAIQGLGTLDEVTT